MPKGQYHGGGRRTGRFQEFRRTSGGPRRALTTMVPESWHEALDQMANHRGISKAMLVREAVRRAIQQAGLLKRRGRTKTR